SQQSARYPTPSLPDALPISKPDSPCGRPHGRSGFASTLRGRLPDEPSRRQSRGVASGVRQRPPARSPTGYETSALASRAGRRMSGETRVEQREIAPRDDHHGPLGPATTTVHRSDLPLIDKIALSVTPAAPGRPLTAFVPHRSAQVPDRAIRRRPPIVKIGRASCRESK